MSCAQPGAQFLKRDVWPARHLGREGVVMGRELELLVVALRPGLGLAGGLAPVQRIVDVGDADLELSRHRLGRQPPSMAAKTRLRRSLE